MITGQHAYDMAMKNRTIIEEEILKENKLYIKKKLGRILRKIDKRITKSINQGQTICRIFIELKYGLDVTVIDKLEEAGYFTIYSVKTNCYGYKSWCLIIDWGHFNSVTPCVPQEPPLNGL